MREHDARHDEGARVLRRQRDAPPADAARVEAQRAQGHHGLRPAKVREQDPNAQQVHRVAESTMASGEAFHRA